MARLKRRIKNSRVRWSRIEKSVKHVISISISASIMNEKKCVYNLGLKGWEGLFLFLLYKFNGRWRGIKDTLLLKSDAIKSKISNKIKPMRAELKI